MLPHVPQPPFALVGAAHQVWERIGATPWLLRQLRYGLQLLWLASPMYQAKSRYDLEPAQARFAEKEVRRWVRLEYTLQATPGQSARLLRRGLVSPGFVTDTAMKLRLVIDYSKVNQCLEERTFRMDQLGDLAAALRPRDALFKADVSDAYYHLRLRISDQARLSFRVGYFVYIPLCLNCGLAVAPWFFTKAMRPVVTYLRGRGHRVFSYLVDFFGAARSATLGTSGVADITTLGDEMKSLFFALGLSLHPGKCDFSRTRRLEILGIVVDTEQQRFLLSPTKLRKIEVSARGLLHYASRHRRVVRARDIRRFARLGNSVSPALVDARLRLRELFNAFKCGNPDSNSRKSNGD